MARDPIRLLHKHSSHGYTSNPAQALPGAGEAITAAEQDELTARSHRTARQQQLNEWQRRKAAMQREIDWLTSQRFRRDVRSEVRALQRQVDSVDKRLR